MRFSIRDLLWLTVVVAAARPLGKGSLPTLSFAVPVA